MRETISQFFPSGEAFYQGLVARVGANAPYHARQVLALRDYYQDEDIEKALQKAIAYKAFHHQSVLAILRSTPLREVNFNGSFCSLEKLGEETPARFLDYYGALLEGGGR